MHNICSYFYPEIHLLSFLQFLPKIKEQKGEALVVSIYGDGRAHNVSVFVHTDSSSSHPLPLPKPSSHPRVSNTVMISSTDRDGTNISHVLFVSS